MEQQFDLTLSSGYKNALAALVGLLLVLGVGLPGTLALLDYAERFMRIPLEAVQLCVAVVVGGGLLALFLVVRRVGGVPTRVIVAENELRVLTRPSGQERRLAFDAIESYDTTFYNGLEEFRLTLRDGKPFTLRIDANYQDAQLQPLQDVVQAFEAALHRHQAQSLPGRAARRNEFAYWARPVATLVLVACAGVLAGLTWEAIVKSRHAGAYLWYLYGLFGAYAAGWYRSRAQRRGR